MKLAEYINSWRKRAGDDGVSGEFSDEYIRDLLNSALCEHVAIRLDLYGSYELMQLVTGDIQKIPPCWQYFGAVDAIVTREGKKIADVNMSMDATAGNMFDSCARPLTVDAKYPQTATATVPKGSTNLFFISPSVAPGETMYARMLVAKQPKPFRKFDSTIKLTCAQYEDLLKYSVGTALALAADSPGDNARGDKQISSFVKGSQYKQQALNAWRGGRPSGR